MGSVNIQSLLKAKTTSEKYDSQEYVIGISIRIYIEIDRIIEEEDIYEDSDEQAIGSNGNGIFNTVFWFDKPLGGR